MILASNRLPVTIATTPDGPVLTPSSGGLASALREYHEHGQGSWIGWLGDTSTLEEPAIQDLFAQASVKRLKPVALTAEEVSLFYDGYSNAVLWPLFHYLLDKVQLDASEEWRAYVAVNERFADAIAAEVQGSETVWIHDYQLTLVPSMLRRRKGSARIGFFLHIPWPSSDVFRILPSRAEVLAGLLGADLIGFHTDNDRQNFAHAAAEVLGLDYNSQSLRWEDREVQLGVYPIGIDVGTELATAITVSPYDILGVAAAIERAMFMSEEEQQLRMRELRHVVEAGPVQAWAASFVRDLEAVEPASPAHASAASELETAVQRLMAAKHRTLLLDYDGTLAPIAELPSLAAPNQQLLSLLRRLVDAQGTAVHIVTGRSQASIEPWLGGLPLWLHVEHGLRTRRPDGTWLPSLRDRPEVIERGAHIMEKYAAKLRGAFVESKAASVAFHYRRANAFGAVGTVSTLRQELQQSLGADVQLLDGHKVLELRQPGVNKNVAVKIALEHAPGDSVVLAAGDDRTDEDMFTALPANALSIRVGPGPSAARLRVESSRALLALLSRLV